MILPSLFTNDIINGIRIIPLEDEGFAVLPGTGILIHLSPTARLVLEYLQTGTTRDQIVREFSGSGMAPASQIKHDVDQLLDTLTLDISTALSSPPAAPYTVKPLSEPVTHAVYLLFEKVVLVRYPNQDVAATCHPLLEPMLLPVETAHDLTVEFEQRTDEYLVRCGLASVTIDKAPQAAFSALQCVILFHDREVSGLFDVVMHAGAVVGPKGAWLVGGASGNGKSTLVARLDAEGHRVLSDDLVPLDLSEQSLLPLPMALSIKESGWTKVSAFRPDLDTVPPQRTSIGKHVRYLAQLNPPKDSDRKGHPFAGLLLPRRKENATPAIKTLGLKPAMIALVDKFGRFPIEPENLSKLIALVATQPRYEIVYDDVEQILPELSKIL